MRKNRFYFLAIVAGFFTLQTYAQNVAINEDGSAPNPQAILDIKSSTKGVLIPRMGTAGRLAIPPTKGLLVYDTTTSSFWYNTGANWQNMAADPATGTGWSLNGNTGTTDNDFLGTTDTRPLFFRVSNLRAGVLDAFMENTFLGPRAGVSNPVGVATGATSNTAIGGSSLFSNTTGFQNTAIGTISMRSNISGFHNTAIGFGSLQSVTTGQDNTALGAYANTLSTSTNATAIGFLAFANGSNKVRIGNSAVTTIEGQVPFTTPSDGRFKYGVKEDVQGLDFILQLRPVTYQFDVERFDEQLQSRQNTEAVVPADANMQAAYNKATAIRRTGFVAQEVEKAAIASGYNFSGLIKPTTEQDYYSISYESFVVPLVKAIQELNRKVASLEKENVLLKAKK